MNKTVGEHQVADGIIVLMAVEIVVIVAERLTQPVTVIEHGGHTVKTESVKTELIHPVLAVGEQVMKHLILAVIEAERTPR